MDHQLGAPQEFLLTAGSILFDAGFWILVSLFAAGLVREYVRTSGLRRVMQHQGKGSLAGALGLGAVLPMCSCGVIPLGVGFYLSGMRLAAVMTFLAATPVINPAAVLLAYALLGPEVTLAYVLFGLTMPVIVGLITERYAGAGNTAMTQQLGGCCSSAKGCGPGAVSEESPAPHHIRVLRALRWGFGELGPTLGFYLGIGVLLAAALMTLTPAGWIPQYLGGDAPLLSLLLVALFGASIYVCAVAHIPLVASLLAAGASPGIAIVFLVTGAVSNLPEFIALQRALGTRTILVYIAGLLGTSILAGWLLNLWLLPEFTPTLDPIASAEWSAVANRAAVVVPEKAAVFSAFAAGTLCLWGAFRWLRGVAGSVRQGAAP